MKKYFLLKVKKDKLQKWKDWCDFLKHNQNEVKQTLETENAIAEGGVLFKVGEDYYVSAYSEYEGIPISSDMSIDLNIKHKKNIDECLEMLGSGEELFDIKRPKSTNEHS